MKRVKPIIPSLRERKRYLVFEIISKGKIGDYKAISGALHASLADFFGDLALSKAGIMVLEDQYKDNKGIIKVNHK